MPHTSEPLRFWRSDSEAFRAQMKTNRFRTKLGDRLKWIANQFREHNVRTVCCICPIATHQQVLAASRQISRSAGRCCLESVQCTYLMLILFDKIELSFCRLFAPLSTEIRASADRQCLLANPNLGFS